MYKLIGTHGCGRCEMVKGILKNKNIEFEYYYMEDLPQEEQDKYYALARENKVSSFPMIIKDEKIVELQEVN
jgi:glutaredoxin